MKKSNIKETWKVINNVLNKNKNHNSITQIKSNNTIIKDNSAIANIFNDYFSSIGPNLAKTIPQTNKTFADFLKNKHPNTIFFIPTDVNEIKKIVEKINSKKSTGYDDISNDLLKHVINEIVIPLEHILNLSIVNGIVPDKMKIAKVVPINLQKGWFIRHK